MCSWDRLIVAHQDVRLLALSSEIDVRFTFRPPTATEVNTVVTLIGIFVTIAGIVVTLLALHLSGVDWSAMVSVW